jgi:hypothetical protein
MTDFTMNALPDRAQVLDCFVQIISGSDRYRLKSLQNIEPILDHPNLIRVADDGTFYLNPQPPQSMVDMLLRLTSDEVDTATPPTNTRTVSWYIYQKNQRNRVTIQVSIVYFAKDSTSNKFLRLNLTFEVEKFSVPRILEEGDVGLPITGRILYNDPVTGADISPTFVRQAS